MKLYRTVEMSSVEILESFWSQPFPWPKGYPCTYCDEPAVEVDHIHPRCLGGGDELRNLIPACRRCNAQKNGKDIDQWLMELWFEGDPRARVVYWVKEWTDPQGMAYGYVKPLSLWAHDGYADPVVSYEITPYDLARSPTNDCEDRAVIERLAGREMQCTCEGLHPSGRDVFWEPYDELKARRSQHE